MSHRVAGMVLSRNALVVVKEPEEFQRAVRRSDLRLREQPLCRIRAGYG